MKICIVCARLSYGGAERVAVSWANGFLKAGHIGTKTHVIMTEHDSFDRPLSASSHGWYHQARVFYSLLYNSKQVVKRIKHKFQ